MGKGNILKLLNNYVALTNQAALCEAMALADRLGVPRQTVGDVVGKSSGASFILERNLAALVQHDYRAGFFVDLARKDLGLGLELAKEVKGESVVGRAAWELYGRASEAGTSRRGGSRRGNRGRWPWRAGRCPLTLTAVADVDRDHRAGHHPE